MSNQFVILLIICAGIFIQLVDSFDDSSNVENTIKHINSVQSLWKADYDSVRRGFGSKWWKNKFGLRLNLKKLKKLTKLFGNTFVSSSASTSSDDIPDNFDSRESWPACKNLINNVRDQATCGSCWAVSLASALSDRFCIASNGTYKMPLSAEDLMRCCTRCKQRDGNGCAGGDLAEALNYVGNYGIVTGGEYESEEGCIPYSFKPCKNECEQAVKNAKTEECVEICSNSNYRTSYYDDKYFIQDYYLLSIEQELIVKKHLMTDGTCLATMVVYEDFLWYKSGIYRPVTGDVLESHVVRLTGWGIKHGFKYWLAANSWGKSWGEDGFFKIRMTQNGSKFGKYVICLVPY